ncbi:MAG: hypothetical protein LIO76_08200 [Clostridiales bacterium]|nr:hypothetical protein [Clostridiales bacterium]
MSDSVKEKIRTGIRAIPSVLFLVFLFYMMINTYTGTVKSTVESTELSVSGFESLTDSLEEVLQSDFYDKNFYINLNGLSTRVLGINTLNERVKLANGHLGTQGSAVDLTENEQNLIELNEFLSDRGIGFVFIPAPGKSSFYGAEYAPGYSSTAWMNIDSMINAMNEAGVSAIDMDAWFEENGWDMDDVYFKTDHHWRPEAALAAARCTMELLSEQGLADYHEEWLQDENWTITVLENWFLGSHGKRTGFLYTGADDFSVYVPDFATDYTYSGLSKGTTTWIYRNTLLDLSYTKEKDYFNDNVYMTYMFADYCLRRTTNEEGWNDKRVLIMGDSYKNTLEYFLTTQFREVYTIDLRYYTDGTLAEYVEEIQPDIVIMCNNNLGMESLYDFGVEEYLEAAETANDDEESLLIEDAVIEAQADNNSNFIVLYTNLEPNQAYTLTLDASAYEGGNDLFVQMSLQNLSTNRAVCNRYFDANSEEKQTWVFTTPESTAGVYAVYLYAGTKGNTGNASVEISNIELREGYPD